MKKLKDLRNYLVVRQAELAALSRDSQRTGNPHLATKYGGGAAELAQVIAEVDRLLVKQKEKVVK